MPASHLRSSQCEGLKTLAPVGDRLRPVEIDPDADAVLDALRVAA